MFYMTYNTIHNTSFNSSVATLPYYLKLHFCLNSSSISPQLFHNLTWPG